MEAEERGRHGGRIQSLGAVRKQYIRIQQLERGVMTRKDTRKVQKKQRSQLEAISRRTRFIQYPGYGGDRFGSKFKLYRPGILFDGSLEFPPAPRGYFRQPLDEVFRSSDPSDQGCQ